MRGRPLNRGALAALLTILWAGNAQAKTCDIAGGNVAFGAYDATSRGNLDTTGSLSISCNGRFQAILSVSVGNGAGATYGGGRKMTRIGGGGTLTYNIYADAARTQVLGDGTGGGATLLINGQNTYTQPIWARILGGQQRVASGSYTDTVVATISY